MCPFCIAWDAINLPMSKQAFNVRVLVRDGAFHCEPTVCGLRKGPVMRSTFLTLKRYAMSVGANAGGSCRPQFGEALQQDAGAHPRGRGGLRTVPVHPRGSGGVC